MADDRVRAALWIVPAGFAVGAGVVVLLMSLMTSSDSGMGALVGAVFVFLAQTALVLSSLAAFLVMLTQVTTPMSSSGRVLVWVLVGTWLALAILGVVSRASASDGGDVVTPLPPIVCILAAAAFAGTVVLPRRDGAGSETLTSASSRHRER